MATREGGSGVHEFAITDPGDEIILHTPYYFNHDMAINIASCRVVQVPLDERYHLDVQRIAEKVRARLNAPPADPPSGV